MNSAQKFALMERLSGTPEGRVRLAASMQQPLRTQRDYTSVIRKLFQVENLPNGALPYYDKDPEANAYVVGDEGQNITQVVGGERYLIPLFEIAALPEVPFSVVTSRRFDVLERTVAKHTAKMGEVEDYKGIAAMDALADDPSNPNPDITVAGVLTSTPLIDGIANISRWDLRPANVLMNAKDYADILKWDRDVLDPKSQAELLHTGIMATMWGMNVIVSKMVPAGTVYMCAEPEFFGRIPVRYDLTVMSADDTRRRVVGFSIFSNLGIGVHNPMALQRIKIIRD